jgi:hypothetical protein
LFPVPVLVVGPHFRGGQLQLAVAVPVASAAYGIQPFELKGAT